MEDDLASGTPRAFIYPLLLAFLYYLMRRSQFPCMVVIVLQGLFYPQAVFSQSAYWSFACCDGGAVGCGFLPSPEDIRFCLVGLIVGLLVLAPFALKTSPYGPIITAAEARSLPEFLPGGRTPFFTKSFFLYWLGGRSGLFEKTMLSPVPLVAGLFLPMILRFSARFAWSQPTSRGVAILMQLSLTSLGLFFIAHTVYLDCIYPVDILNTVYELCWR